MSTRSKVFLFLGGLLFVLAVGIIAIILAVKFATGHVPGRAVLVLDLSGPIPETTPDSPFGELFGPRPVSLMELRDGLAKAAGDDRIRAVRVRVGDLLADFAVIQELRDHLARVAAAGKATVAYLDTAGEFAPGNAQYFTATGCQRIVLNPMGDVNLVGLSVSTPFIRGTFDKLGIEPDFPGRGDYKTARFFYSEKDFTPAHREMIGWLVDSLMSQMTAGIAESRRLAPAQVRALYQRAPFIASEAVAEKLVDQLSDWPSFVEDTGRDADGKLAEVSLRRYLKSGRPDRSGSEIAVIVAEGAILRGQSGYSPVPLFGGDIMGSDTIARAFRQVRASDAKAVVFRINSPGGSAVASELIREEMTRTAKTMPVVVSMSGVAASGGYWITCGANRIVADPGTITASIGVFAGHFATERFFSEKLGVTWGRLDSAPSANLYDSIEPWTPEQRAHIDKLLDRIYDSFLERVSSSRRLSRDAVDAIGRGRVFTGEQAKEKGLVDVLGGLDVALDEARALAGLAPVAPVSLELYPRARSLWQQLTARDEEAHASALLRALIEGRVEAPGAIWMPPLVVR